MDQHDAQVNVRVCFEKYNSNLHIVPEGMTHTMLRPIPTPL